MKADPDRVDPQSEHPADEAESRTRVTSLLLVLVSVGVVVALLIGVAKEDVFAEWRGHQREYAGLLADKATDDAGRDAARDHKVAVRQIVIPGRGVVDRCITCHEGIDDPRMGDVPQPHTAHPGDYLTWHEPNAFGCTACHDGDGRALTYEKAKGDENWDYPLLPVALTQASCGRCHGADDVREAGGEKFALGEDLYFSRGCASCHKLGGRGGTLGPDLGGEGLKIPHELDMTHVAGPHTVAQWLAEHFEDPQAIVPESQMKPPQLSPDETDALTLYMLSLGNRNLPTSVLAPSKHHSLYQQSGPLNLTGEELFERFCANCHDTGTYGRHDDFYAKFIPAVRGVTFAATADDEYIETNIRNGRPGTLMPAWGKGGGGLSDDEIVRIRKFLTTPTGEPAHDVNAGPIPVGAMGRMTWDAASGAEIFARHCAGCHGADGSGGPAPELSNSVFQASASESFIFGTVATGRRNTAMPSFLAPRAGGLDAADVSDLVAYVRTLGSGAAVAAADDDERQASAGLDQDNRRMR